MSVINNSLSTSFPPGTPVVEKNYLDTPVFGIIDSDYARIFTQARIIAWSYGYSCCAQGTFTRDLDLLLVPWTENAASYLQPIINYIADITGTTVNGEPSIKPHGRKSWTLLLPGFNEVRWVDISGFELVKQLDVNADHG